MLFSGLFGDDGILPARVLLEGQQHRYNIFNHPTLQHYANLLGGDVASTMDLVALIGALIALAGFVSTTFCIIPTFIVLWILYFALVQVAQVFTNQADLLLLEAGFYCVFLAPFFKGGSSSPVDGIGLLMIRYLLFRFMFASGAVKLASGCKFWWNLTALKQHLETLPLPTFLSWYAYHIPEDYLKLTTVFVYLSELVCPWLFFAPNRTIRRFAFYWQMFLQFHIILTGNYGILNFLITALLFSLLDNADTQGKKKKRGMDVIGVIATGMILALVAYLALKYFGLEIKDGKVSTEIKFTKDQYAEVLQVLVQLGPMVAVVCVIATFLKTIFSNQFQKTSNVFKKLLQIINLLFFTVAAVGIIALSTVPHGNITPATNITSTQMGKSYRQIYPLKIINEYGQHLRKIRPVRVEVILEHASSSDGPWREYPFQYKPYDVSLPLPFSGPYLSRLDYKFYEVADSTYWNEIWLNSLAFRLLQNKLDVLNLFGVTQKIKPEPVFVRAVMYKFKYTPWNDKSDAPYWTRQQVGEYFPPLALNDTSLHSQMKKLHIPLSGWKSKPSYQNPVKNVLDILRAQLNNLEGSFFIFTVVAAAFALLITQKAFN